MSHLGVSGGDGNHEFLTDKEHRHLYASAHQNGVSSGEGTYVGRQ
jgi:hypothetical protein